MIKILLDEKEYAERLIASGNIDINNPSYDVNIIVRYLYHIKRYSSNEIVNYVDEFMYKYYIDYNDFAWYPSILKYISRAQHRPLVQIDSIPITAKEMSIISCIGDKKIERLLFVFLVIAKYKNIAYNMDGWVSEAQNDIFKEARVSCSDEQRDYIIYDLHNVGLITPSISNRKLNWKVEFIDHDNPPIYLIDDLRELGLRYLALTGDNRIHKCIDCNKLFIKKNKMNSLSIRCEDCQKINNIKMHKEFQARNAFDKTK